MTSEFSHLGDDPVAQLARLKVVSARFRDPDGGEFQRDVIRNQQVVAMLPLLDDGRVLLVRQYRGPIDTEILEIPAGLCDVDGEVLEATARRELVEEVGREAGQLEKVAEFYPAAGFSDQHVTLFLASELVEVASDRQGPEETHMTLTAIDLAAVPEMIANADLVDSKTIIALLLLRDRLARS